MDTSLRIAKLIKLPINKQHRVPVAIEKICDIYYAEPGDHVYRIQNIDVNVDIVFELDANGKLTQIKRTPLADVELTFKHYNSKKEYVLVSEMMDTVDTDALSRRKESITRGMDKKELQLIINALITPTNAVYPANDTANAGITVVSGDDLYDVFQRAVHKLEDWGDGYKALIGTTVKEKIDVFDKENASTFNYNVDLSGKIQKLGIETFKIFGKVADAAETETDLLDKKKFIMIATDSSLVNGKPISFIRRRIPAALAEEMGADVDTASRALFVGKVPESVDFSGTSYDVLGYSVFGYASYIFCVTNPSAVVVGDLNAII